MWVLFLYLIRDGAVQLYSIVAAVFEWAVGRAERPELSSIAPVLDTLMIYGIVAVANGVILIVWARYNQYSESGPDHLGERKLVSVADLAALYGLPEDDIARWQQARNMIMKHGSDGRLIEVVMPEQAQKPA